jgi:hypothetical protein
MKKTHFYLLTLLTSCILFACKKNSTQPSTSTNTNQTTGNGTNTTNNKVCTVCLIEKEGKQVPKSLAGSYSGTEADVTSWENEFRANNQNIPNILPVCYRKTDYDKIVCTECYVLTNGKKTISQTFTSYESEVKFWEQTLTSNNAGVGTTICKRKGYLKDNQCVECEVVHSGGSSLNAQYVGTPTELTTWENEYKSLNSNLPGFTSYCYRK